MNPKYLTCLCLIGLFSLSAALYCATNEPPLAPPPNLRASTNPVVKLESVEAAKTNIPVPRVEQSGNSGTFEEGVIFGALAFARNPDVRDPKVIVEIARGLWQAQKRADAQRQTNSTGK